MENTTGKCDGAFLALLDKSAELIEWLYDLSPIFLHHSLQDDASVEWLEIFFVGTVVGDAGTFCVFLWENIFFKCYSFFSVLGISLT